LATGTRWLENLTTALGALPLGTTRVNLNVADVDWIGLFEWTSACALLASHLSRRIDLEIDFVRAVTGEHNVTAAEFARAIGTDAALMAASDIAVGMVASPSRRRFTGVPTVLMGLMAIRSDLDAIKYLDQRRINTWRSAMLQRFADAPLLHHEALWRLLCFELASNIAEHSGGSGFIAAHLVQPTAAIPSFDFASRLRASYDGPFLNLCVADSGHGLLTSLEGAYRARHDTAGAAVDPAAVVSFAFHEIGSRKDFLSSWITDRHALSRCLHLVEQYAGIFRIRTSGIECVYDLTQESAQRITNGYGYKPTSIGQWPGSIAGTHIQILMPLAPRKTNVSRSTLRRALPSRYSIESEYPIGHYVPLSSYFTDTDSADLQLFGGACHRLAEVLMRVRPADEPIVFDMDFVSWTRRHIETFVILLENVLSRRAVLLMRVPVALAEELGDKAADVVLRRTALLSMLWQRVLIRLADEFRDKRKQLASTSLLSVTDDGVNFRVDPLLLSDEVLVNAVRGAWHHFAQTVDLSVGTVTLQDSVGANFVSWESRMPIAEDRFRGLHDVWDTILAQDTEGNPHVLTYEGGVFTKALTALIESPTTAEALAEDLHAPLARLTATLLRCQPLFGRDRKDVWSCCWDAPTLSAQRFRSAVIDFARVVKLNDAWRGKSPYGATKRRESFYLPGENRWLDGFLQCSRIFARERYIDEIAQRLVSSISTHISGPMTLAAATTPGLMLANALARWWRVVRGDADEPRVLDLGGNVFEGTALSTRVRGRFVVVQDVVATGVQTFRLRDILLNAGADEVFCAAYVRMTNQRDDGSRFAVLTRDDSGEELFMTWLVTIEPPATTTDPATGRGAFRVDSRTLHPIERETVPRLAARTSIGQSEPVDLLTWEAENFDRHPPLIRIGHFVVGRRHHIVTVDVKELCKTDLAGAIAEHVAAICLGRRSLADNAPKTDNDISAVLLPLDSQVSYLWPRVQSCLVRAGRRQPFWYLEATSDLGDTPIFLAPRPLLAQARRAAQDGAPLRLLLLDDAIISGATAHHVLVMVQHAAERVYRQHGRRAVESVKCFGLIDRLTKAEYRFSMNVQTFGNPPFKVEFETPLAMLGPRPFNESSCPACDELQTVREVKSSATATASPRVLKWCEERERDLAAVPIELLPSTRERERLRKPIVVSTEDAENGFPSVPLAIARFQQLMLVNHPIIHVLERLPLASLGHDESGDPYADYRWAVIGWCLRHVKRYTTFPPAARASLLAALQHECKIGARILPSIFAECAKQPDEITYTVFTTALDTLAMLRVGLFETLDTDIFDKAVTLETALLVFLALLRARHEEDDVDRYDSLVEKYASRAEVTPNRIALRRILNRAGAFSDQPARIFALRSLAETLCRERKAGFGKHQAHDLLPKLVIQLRLEPDNVQHRHFASELLSLFVRSAETLELFTGFFSSGAPEATLARARSLLEALVRHDDVRDILPALGDDFEPLRDRFMGIFATRFNTNIGEFVANFDQKRQDRGARLTVDYAFSSELEPVTLLTDATRLGSHLMNIVVDPFSKDELEGPNPSMAFDRVVGNDGRDRIVITARTRYGDPAETAKKLENAPKYKYDVFELQQWGCDVAQPVTEMDWSVFRVYVPIGFPLIILD
jgi:adenine/guanine phosphoribosyltransferase-like PRPP-binding protein